MFDVEWRFWDYVWFIGIPLLFLIVAAGVFLPRFRQRFREASRLPFRDEPRHKHTDGRR